MSFLLYTLIPFCELQLGRIISEERKKADGGRRNNLINGARQSVCFCFVFSLVQCGRQHTFNTNCDSNILFLCVILLKINLNKNTERFSYKYFNCHAHESFIFKLTIFKNKNGTFLRFLVIFRRILNKQLFLFNLILMNDLYFHHIKI